MTSLPFSGDSTKAAAPLAVTLRPYQQAALDAVYDWFERGLGNPLVVVPTGGGKSLIMASFIHGVVMQWPQERIMVLTHVRELIRQNYEAMLRIWPGAPAGIYSAGLSRREHDAPILFAGIQSVHKKAAKLGWADLILIDEAHLVPKKMTGMYRRLLDDLRSMNPKLKVIGLTATPFRTDSGRLDEGEGRLFDGVCYECDLVQLVDDGYLASITMRGSAATIDTSQVHSRGGDFIPAELQAAAMKGDMVRLAVDEIVARGAERKSWLLFGTGIAHARAIAAAVEDHGIECGTVFGDTPSDARDAVLGRFKRGDLRAIANYGVLTTGFDAPNVDLIALLRPTQSPGLYVQMVGRGLRRTETKTDCLVLDFGSNVKRHGPINKVRAVKDDGGDGKAPIKECPGCHLFVPAATRVCPECQHEFPPAETGGHKIKPDEDREILERPGAIEDWTVSRTTYAMHSKPGKPISLRVTYHAGFHQHVSEWVCLEHGGYPQVKAAAWWRERSCYGATMAAPASVDEALVRIEGGELREAATLKVDGRGEYLRVLGVRLKSEAGLGDEVETSRGRPTPVDDSEIPF